MRKRLFVCSIFLLSVLVSCDKSNIIRRDILVDSFNVVKSLVADSLRVFNSIEVIINDMQLPHEGKPHGVPKSWSWASRPVIQKGSSSGIYEAMIAWGHLYEDERGNPAINTRVQIRNIKAYVFSKRDERWNLVQDSRLVKGAAYREDFAEDFNKPADVRFEQDGTVSVKAGGGYNFHFWPATGRAEIDLDDVGGIFTTVQARLVIDDESKLDDRDKALYLLGMGGDYWLNLTAEWSNFATNAGIAVGRFKYVKKEWGAFNMITFSENEIRENPPPIEY